MQAKEPLTALDSVQNRMDDEIDLFELWTGLVEEKWTVFVSFTVVVLLAGAYAFMQPKNYEVSTAIKKPLPQNNNEFEISWH